MMMKDNKDKTPTKKIQLILLSLTLLLSTVACSQAALEQSKSDESIQQSNNEQNIIEEAPDKEERVSAVQTIPAVVDRVVDGDTVKVKFEDGKEETIRLLLIDTPETVHPNKPVQPFGPEASAAAKELMPPGKKVGVELDVSERDKYGRVLAYVYVGGQMVNEVLLKQGLARVAYVFPPNTKYVDHFREIQDEARQKQVGIWSLENYATEEGFDPAVDPTDKETVPSAEQETEKQTTSLRYDPNGPDRDCGDFTTQDEAQAFFDAAGGPNEDPHRLDRDGDGIACDSLP